jgi:hypothetical protein
MMGVKGDNPLGNTQLSIGAKMHIRMNASIILSIKTPSHTFFGGQKKRPKVNYSSSLNVAAPLNV